ncbi:Annexin protein, partial [Phytophthora megakarya]
ILLGRTNEELSMLKSTYYYIFNKDLTWLMRSELSGDYREVILLALERLQVTYDPEIHTYAKAKADAIKLYDAVNDIYKKKYVSDLEEAIRGEFSGYATESLVFYVRLALEPEEVIADHFERMLKGLGTDEKGLSAAVIRYHWMQPQVEQLYEKRFGRSLEERIRTDTDANYGDLLVTLLHIPTDGSDECSVSSNGSVKEPECES